MTSRDDDAPVRATKREDADEAPGDGAVPSGTAPRRKKRARRNAAAEGAAIEGAAVESAAAPPPTAVGAPREVMIDEPGVVAVRHQLLLAAGAAAAGVAMVGTGPSDVGMWVAIVGGIGLVASIHRLGRLGPPAVPGSGADGTPGPRMGSDRGA